MADSSTVIANLAISHLGYGSEIANLDTENSAEANAMRRFYDTARRNVLREFAWPFAYKIADLGLVESTPNNDWNYSYRYPSDCLMMNKILSGVRNDHRQSRIPFKVGRDSSGKLIFTDEQNAQAAYTMDNQDTLQYPDDFVMAFSYRLAIYAAPRIVSNGDPFGLVQRLYQIYNIEVQNAKAMARQENQPDDMPQSEFIRARE